APKVYFCVSCRFPLYNPRKLKKWLNNMRWKDWTPSRFSVLCINHFEEQHIDRTGKNVTLREDAVPTVFLSSDTDSQKKKMVCSFFLCYCGTNMLPYSMSLEHSKSERWRIIIDDGLMKIASFPHFFHGDYCVPQVSHVLAPMHLGTVSKPHPHKEQQQQWCKIQMQCKTEVKEPWQWLSLDVRGPLPQTLNGHKFLLSVSDLHSKWVEAVPMATCLPLDVAKNVADIVSHLGYPLGILSRLPQEIILFHQINRELKELLKVSVALMVHHHQTGTADTTTPPMIDSDLLTQHSTDWDVHLPAQVFSLCFTEHPQTKQRPFVLLCCTGREAVRSPRPLDVLIPFQFCAEILLRADFKL
uniref:THAP-type domain-containing protein n=1 Tax=Gouania willdenowi TaxID=441366 RepID=A0A8C5EES3_GOUWI